MSLSGKPPVPTRSNTSRLHTSRSYCTSFVLFPRRIPTPVSDASSLYTIPLHPRITPTLVSIPFRNLFHSSCPPHTLRVVHIRHHFFIFSHFLRRNTRSRHVLLTYFPSSFPHNTTPCSRSSLAAHLVYGHSAPTRRRRRRPRSSILTSY